MTTTHPDLFNAHVLIVDDQPANVELLRRMLGEAGYVNVSSTMNPQVVCAQHRKEDYDLILLDLQMPAMDGFQVIEALKTSDVDAYLPVIVLTAQPGHRMRALQAGVRDFISKPFDLLEVQTRIRNMLEVRLLYRALERSNQALERKVHERTAELRESEARFRSLTELACDWYWEQDESGSYSRVHGPVLEMLGLQVSTLTGSGGVPAEGWNESERSKLQAMILARQPFLDFAFSRVNPDGSRQSYRVSGEPIFGSGMRFVGYRGVGLEVTQRH
jgi:PAS domain S-box-containing protein